MNISDFFYQYADEASCKAFFKAKKEQKGIVCQDFASIIHYWIEKENSWKCKCCGKSYSKTVAGHFNY